MATRDERIAEIVNRDRAGAEAVGANAPVDAIAIVGIGCRYADARGPDEFWEIVRSGRNTVRDVPEHRVELGYDIDHFYDPRPRIPGKISSRKGGFLEHPELFDPAAFGIAPRDALTMEPQQRLMIEVTWDALEDAGIVPESVMGERVAVILGYMAEDYSRERAGVLGEAAVFRGHDVFTVGGMSHAVLSGRIAYLLGVTGPSLTLDTACSSSLIATHLACESLRRGESKMAIAGGANVFLSPEGNIALSRSGMLSMSGACKAFDASADGFVRAEGAGVVVLRPLADALADRNPIYAVIRGSGISTDGRDGGHMMAPGRHGQAQAMRDAYAQAGIDPAEVQYVETHGTGTMIGDPVEIAALAEVMGPGRSPANPLRVASVKGNLGHTESASGVAGLIKTALAIRHRTLPAQLHFETPNPAIPWDEYPVRVQSETTGWPSDGRFLAGVNSFGISGTNAHVVLESPPPSPAAVEHAESSSSRAPSRPRLVPLSAHDPKALDEMATGLRLALEAPDAPAFDDLAYTLLRRRSHRPHRLCVVARSNDELRAELLALEEGRSSAALRSATVSVEKRPSVVMVFPGQGSQWLGMGRGLLETEPVFAGAINRIETAYLEHVDWSLRAALEGRADFDWTARLDVLQPLLVAMEIALAELWASWGIRPDRVIGQSMGELAAAFVAGHLGLEDVARIACHRGRIVARASGKGAMAVVSLAREAVEAELVLRDGRVEIAGANSPTTTIVSGDRDAVLSLVASFEARDVFARPLEVDFASHCFHMEPLRDAFREGIEGFQPRAGEIAFDSTVDEGELSGTELDVDYWLRNLREPVAFDRGLARSIEAGGEIFLEVSPHATLGRATLEIAEAMGQTVAHVGSLQRDQDESHSLATSLAELFVRGVELDLVSLQDEGRVVGTPLYAYQRRRFWFSERNRLHQFRPVHPLLGVRSDSSLDPRLHTWDFVLDADSAGFMADHAIDGRACAPSGLFPELALAAAEAVWSGRAATLVDLEIPRSLDLPRSGRTWVQVILRVDDEGTGEIRVASRIAADAPWALHAVGRLEIDAGNERRSAEPLDRSENSALPADLHFGALERCGVELGPRCRTLRELESAPNPNGEDRSLVARLMLPRAIESEWYAYHAHPALLEGSLQLIGTLLDPAAAVRVTAIGGLSLSAGLGSDCWCRITLRASRPAGPSDGAIADLEFFDRDGKPIGRVDAVRVERRPERSGVVATRTSGVHRAEWKLREKASREAVAAREVERWILVSDVAGEAAALGAELQKRGMHTFFCEKVEDLGPLVQRLRAESDSPWGLLLLAWSDAPFGQPKPDRAEGDPLPHEQPTNPALASEAASHRAFRIGSWAAAIREEGADASQVWLATRGMHRALDEESQSIATGRLIAREIDTFATGAEMFQCHLFDTSLDLDHRERIVLAGLLGRSGEERQFAARGEDLYVRRLASLDAVALTRPKPVEIEAGDRNFRAVHSAGTGVEGLALEAIDEVEHVPGSVVVEVRHAALGQLDVLAGLGLSTNLEADASRLVGQDFSGVVLDVDETVSGLRVGDEVMGVSPGSLSRRLCVPANFVTRKPGSIDLREAAGLPLPFLVARFALETLARLQASERVLILSAAGGVGQALIQVARSCGADVRATANSVARRALLVRQGVRLLDASGDSDGADSPSGQDGEFDVIVGSLSGAPMHAMLERLAPGGRYIDLCPRSRFDRPELGALRLAANRSLSSLDIAEVMRSQPNRIADWLEALSADVERGHVEPIPIVDFDVSDAARAIRFMAQNRHVGRVAIDFEKAESARLRSVGSGTSLAGRGAYLVHADADRSSGLGEEIAAWLRSQDADEVVSSRDGDPTELIDSLERRGVPLAGWFHWTSDVSRGGEAFERFVSSERIPRRVLISERTPIEADPSRDRAWESRLTVDGLLLASPERGARALHLAVGPEVEPGAILESLGRWIRDPEFASQLVLMDDAEIARRSDLAPTPILEGSRRGQVRFEQGRLMRSELLSKTPAERRGLIQRFVCDAIAEVLGLSEEQRTSIEIESRLAGLGLDSLMTMEFFMGMGRDLGLEIAADWFDSPPTLAEIAAVLLDRFEANSAGSSE